MDKVLFTTRVNVSLGYRSRKTRNSSSRCRNDDVGIYEEEVLEVS